MSDTLLIGKHEVRYDAESGFIYLTQVGLMDGAEVVAVANALRTFAARSGLGEPPFILADGRRAAGFTTDGRKAVTTSGDASMDGSVVACFGIATPLRVILNLVMKGVMLTASIKTVMGFVANAEEGRAWLTEQRRAYRAQNAAQNAKK